MNELEFLLLTRVLTQNFNTMDLVRSLEKKSKTSHVDHISHIEGDIMQNHEGKKKVKKSKIPRFYGQNKLLS
jgi:ribosomal protein L18E